MPLLRSPISSGSPVPSVAALLDDSCLSTVNLAEVIGRFARDGHDPRDVLQRVVQSPIGLVPFLAEDTALAAALIPSTRPLGLSLGDRACLALGWRAASLCPPPIEPG